MVTKIAKIDDNIYQVNNGEIPIDTTSVRNLVQASGIEDVNDFMDKLDEKGNIELEDNFITANKGTVVNVYEVDYPQPKDPNKESQEMVSYLDEYEDAVSQNIFPGVSVEDVIITTRENLKNDKVGPGRFLNEQELREKAGNIKRGWKERLRDSGVDPFKKQTYPEARKRAKEILQLLNANKLLNNNVEYIDIKKLASGYRIRINSFYNDIMSLHLENDENEDVIIKKLPKVQDYIYKVENLLDSNGFEDCAVIIDYLGSVNIIVPFQSQKQSSWRKILGETETAPSPVKTPTKIPQKPPEKEPKINPFRKPDHIKPSQEPQPKALPVTYPPGTSLKMHPELEQTINKKDTPYHALPQVPGGEFIENIASDRFKIVLRNLERYSGRRVRSLQDMMRALIDVLQKINNIEQHYTSQLEDLAVSMVEQQFGIDPREVGFDAKLVREVSLEDITNISPQEERSLEESISNANIDLEVSKRRFINGLIQGAGINSLNMFHLVGEELNTIDPDLINMYGLLTAFAEIGYWVIPQSMIGSASGGVFGGGKVKLDFSQEEPKIVAVAVNFPILVQELVKGVMELLSSHGLPEDESIREQVLNKADTLEDESWDIRFGPEIWKKLLSHLNVNDLNGRALSILYHNFVQMDAATFSDFVNKILSNDQESINKWNEMYQEALNQSSGEKTSSLQTYSTEEELISLYNQYRKEMLSEGKTPELYRNWIRNKENVF